MSINESYDHSQAYMGASNDARANPERCLTRKALPAGLPRPDADLVAALPECGQKRGELMPGQRDWLARRPPLACWPGGKSQLASLLLALFPPHRLYCEVFGGAAWLLFLKEPASLECLNDLDDRLINFFRVCRERPGELLERGRYLLYSRKLFYEWGRAPWPEDPVEAAFRFYYLVRAAWSFKGKSGGCFRVKKDSCPLVHARLFRQHIAWAAKRLDRVYIENLPWQKLLALYDTPGSFFYLDPPYWTPGKKSYRHNFSLADFQELARALASIRGRFLLTVNDCPEMRACFGQFRIRPVRGYYNIGHNASSELVVANYELPLAASLPGPGRRGRLVQRGPGNSK